METRTKITIISTFSAIMEITIIIITMEIIITSSIIITKIIIKTTITKIIIIILIKTNWIVKW